MTDVTIRPQLNRTITVNAGPPGAQGPQGPAGNPASNLITSVFGRVGVVVATLGDYAATLISYAGAATGSTVAAALDWLAGQVAAILVTLSALAVTVAAKIGFSDLSVASIAALAPVNAPDGTSIYVRTLRDWFTYRAASTATVDGITVLAHVSTTGRWERACRPAYSWQQQVTWEINSGSSPENDGTTAGTAIPYSEFLRRRADPSGVFLVPSGVTLQLRINANMPDTDPFLFMPVLHAGAILTVTGIMTPSFVGTVSAVTNLSTAGTGTCHDVTSTWTPANELNKLVYDGTNYAWVAKDLTGGRARVSPWMAINTSIGAFATTAAVLNSAVGRPLTTYTQPTVARAITHVVGAAIGISPCLIQNLKFIGDRVGILRSSSQVAWQNCDFGPLANRFGGGSHVFNNCRLAIGAPVTVEPCLFNMIGGLGAAGFSNTAHPCGVTWELANHCLWQGTNILGSRQGLIRVRNIFFEDVLNTVAFGACITAAQGAVVAAASGTTVRGNGCSADVLRLDATCKALNGAGVLWAANYSVATTGHNGIKINGLVTTACAIDPSTRLPNATPRTLTFANLDATYAAGGFGGYYNDPASDTAGIP